MALNLTQLRDYARDLTGVYSQDLVDNTLLTQWINEEYRTLSRIQNWPWSSSVVDLVGSTDTPVFADEYHQYLAYRAAVKLLQFEADDTQRSQQYAAEADSLLQQMILKYLQAEAHSTTGTMAALIRNVRDWLGVYNDTVSDDLIEARIMDAYNELYESQTWPFDRDPFPGMGWEYTRALVFSAAGRLAGVAGKNEEFVKAMFTEYSLAAEELRTVFLLNPAGTGSSNLGELAALVRTIVGDFSKAVPDQLIKLWINEEYQLLCNEKDWAWLEQTMQATYPAGTSQFSLPDGTRNVLEMYMVEKVAAADGMEKPVAQSEIVHSVPHVMDIERNAENFKYDVTSAGLVTISPAPERSFTIRARYRRTANQLVNNTDVPLMAAQFRSILAYRAGIRVASYAKPEKPVLELCAGVAQSMFDTMYSFYQLEHSMEPFQVGGIGLETRKYLPWFRTA